MAVAFGAQGTTPSGTTANITGTTSVTPAAPTMNNGDMVLIVIQNKADTATPSTPANWSLGASNAGGFGASAANTGATRTTIFYREKDASWSTMPTITITSGNAATAQAFTFTKAAGTLWNLAFCVGAKSDANATAYSATATTNPGLTDGDGVLVAISVGDDTPTHSLQSISATGVTVWGTVTERSEPKTSTGNDVGGVVFTNSVTLGTSTAAPVVNDTISVAHSGPFVLVRLREITITNISASESNSLAVSESSVKKDGVFVGNAPPFNVLLVHDDPTPAATDVTLKGVLESFGHTVTNQSEASAPPSDTSTYDVVVHTETGSSTSTAITAYPTMNVPLVFLETSWNNIRMSTAAATNPTSTTQYDIIATGHEIVEGLSDPFSWRDTASGNYGVTTAEKASGTEQICAPQGNTGHCTILVAEEGATLTTGTAPKRRVCSGIAVGSAPAAWVTDAQTVFNQMVEWAAGGGQWIFPDSIAGSESNSLAVSDSSDVEIIELVEKAGSESISIAVSESADVDESVKVLPAALGTGISPESQSYVAPIIDSNGNLYTIMESLLAQSNQPKAMKSTDGGQTWNEMDAANRPGTDTGSIGDLESGWIVWDSSAKVMHFVWQRSYAAWSGFRTSDHPTNPDTWVSNTRENVAAFEGTPQYASITMPTDQSYDWIFYGNAAASGYRSRTGSGSYGTAQTLAATAIGPAAALGNNNVSHVIYNTGTQLFYKSLSSDGTLGSAVRVDTNGTHSVSLAHAKPIPYMRDGSTEVVTCLFINSSKHLKAVDIVNGTPGAEQTITTSAVAIDGDGGVTTGSAGAYITGDVDGTKVHAIWVDTTSGDIYHSERPDAGSWSTPDMLVDMGAQRGLWLYARVLQYPSSARVLAYTYDRTPWADDGGNIHYNELELSGGATPVAGSESNSLSVSDSSALAVTEHKSASDTAAISVSETTAMTRSFSSADTAAITVSESIDLLRPLVATDSASISVTDIATTLTREATDTGAISVSESVSVVVTIGANDSGSISVSETTSFANTATATDTAAVAVSEVSNVASSLPGTETVAIGVTETTSILVTNVASDTSGLSVSETTEVLMDIVKSGAETTAIQINETTDLFITKIASETNSIAVSEQTAFDKALVATDSGSIAVSEVSSIGNTLPGTESIPLSVTDTAQISVSIIATDSVAVSVSDAAASELFSTATDQIALSLTESTEIFVTFSTSDASSIQITDQSNFSNDIPGADNSSIAITETRQIEVFVSSTDGAIWAVEETVLNEVTQPSTDNISIGLQETTSGSNQLVGSDSISISIDEQTTLTIDKTVNATDSASLSITESSSVFVPAPGQDTATLMVSESVELVQGGVIEKEASDTNSIQVSEGSANTFVISAVDTATISTSETTSGSVLATATDSASLAVSEGRQQAATIATTDSASLIVSEVTAFGQIDRSASDSAAISVSESANVSQSLPGQETISLAVSEQAQIEISGTITKTSSDNITISVVESGAYDVFVSRQDTLPISVSESTNFGTGENQTTDTLSITITESVHIHLDVSSSDTLVIGLSENASPEVFEGFDFVSSTDSLGVGVEETRVVVREATNFDTKSDRGTIITSNSRQQTIITGSSERNTSF